MGNKAAKFRSALHNNNHEAALALYQSERKLRENLNPNTPYSKQYDQNTPVHYAAKYAMPKMLALLLEKGGDPNKTNMHQETSLHVLTHTTADTHRRLECFHLLMRHRGNKINAHGVYLERGTKIRLNPTDNKGNTPLHRAAGCGFDKCVELLLAQHVVATLTNEEGRTAAEEATHFHHNEIGHRIEARILYDTADDDMLARLHGLQAQDISTLVRRLVTSDNAQNGTASHCGLNLQELRAEKDQILVYISEMLQLPLVLTETLLKSCSWNHQALMDRFQMDPRQVFEAAGIDESVIAAAAGTTATNSTATTATTTATTTAATTAATHECMICMSVGVCAPVSTLLHGEIVKKQGRPNQQQNPTNHLVLVQSSGCSHMFCTECWSSYLGIYIENANTEGITCPAHANGCRVLVPSEYIDALVSVELAQKYQKFDLDAFVKSNLSFRFCPHPGCKKIVKRLKDCNQSQREHMMVDCGDGHIWCWSCFKTPHEPCTCDMWDVWFSHVKLLTGRDVKKVVTQDFSGDGTKSQNSTSSDIADELWLAANTKPCPQCKTPISKGDGCHHMTCRVCKHEWCWLCGDLWSKHSKQTGGFYSCNRFRGNNESPQDRVTEAPEEETSNQAHSSSSRSRNRDRQVQQSGVKNTENIAAIRRRGLAMDKFLHYYSRFEAHFSSLHIERRYLDKTQLRIGHLERASQFERRKSGGGGGGGGGGDDVGFQWLHQAILELVKNRLVLSASYAFACFEFGGARKQRVDIEQEMNQGQTQTPSSVASSESKKPDIAAQVGFLSKKAQTTMVALEAIMGKSIKTRRTVTQEQQLFEMQQADLEMVTEQLSEMVARNHVRVTRETILKTALQARRDRQIFTTSCSNGMIPDQSEQHGRGSSSGGAQRRRRHSGSGGGRKRNSSQGSSGNGSGSGSAGIRNRRNRSNDSRHRRNSDNSTNTHVRTPPAPPSSLGQQLQPPTTAGGNSGGMSRASALLSAAMMESWQCSTCTLINTRTLRCVACDTPNIQTESDDDQNIAQSLQAQLYDVVRQQESTEPTWSCGFCTVINPASRVRCSVCRSDRAPKLNDEGERDQTLGLDLVNSGDGGGEATDTTFEEDQTLLGIVNEGENEGEVKIEDSQEIDIMNLFDSDDEATGTTFEKDQTLLGIVNEGENEGEVKTVDSQEIDIMDFFDQLDLEVASEQDDVANERGEVKAEEQEHQHNQEAKEEQKSTAIVEAMITGTCIVSEKGETQNIDTIMDLPEAEDEAATAADQEIQNPFEQFD